MIISASRRTDIPAFYADWFMNRIEAGHCLVPNPFNANQISRISLAPADVDALVFWSKDPRPMLEPIRRLDDMGFVSYFLFTLNDYPAIFEPALPPLEQRIETFKLLARTMGTQRVIWRYDPIIISSSTPYPFHEERFSALAQALSGSTERVIVSIIDYYHKTNRRFAPLENRGITFDRQAASATEMADLLAFMSRTAGSLGMEIQSCAEQLDYSDVGVPPGPCIDPELIDRLGGSVSPDKDRGQRAQCLCATSRDIGVTDTCLHGCTYCYATRSNDLAQRRHKEHDPTSPMLWGRPPKPEQTPTQTDEMPTLFPETGTNSPTRP